MNEKNKKRALKVALIILISVLMVSCALFLYFYQIRYMFMPIDGGVLTTEDIDYEQNIVELEYSEKEKNKAIKAVAEETEQNGSEPIILYFDKVQTDDGIVYRAVAKQTDEAAYVYCLNADNLNIINKYPIVYSDINKIKSELDRH